MVLHVLKPFIQKSLCGLNQKLKVITWQEKNWMICHGHLKNLVFVQVNILYGFFLRSGLDLLLWDISHLLEIYLLK